MLGGKARAGPWALSVTVMPQLLGLPLTVSFLSPPVSISLLVSLLFLSSLAVSTSCLLALLRPQHPGGSEAMCPWYVSDRAPSLLWLLLPFFLLLLHIFPLHHLLPIPASLGLPAPQPHLKALPVPLRSPHSSLAGPAKASGPHSSDSPL